MQCPWRRSPRVLTRHPPPDRLPAVLPVQGTAQRDLLSVRAETLASRPIVTCAPDDTVTPSRPTATIGEVMLAMVDRGIHHLPLSRQGRLVGIVSDTDLLRRESHQALLVRRQLERADGPEELAAYAREVTTVAARLGRGRDPAR
jgi:signal-transduction protein with cAMP-binding, CBS, and nucleotidyltransferase domain